MRSLRFKMFQPYILRPAKPQKNRSYRSGGGLLRLLKKGILHLWPRIVALGPGCLAPSLVERLVIWGKRNILPTETQRRFWVNLQVASILTRKPANVRMGKGKGGRRGTQACIHAGTTLIGFSALRPGLLEALRRRVQVRCGFRIGVYTEQGMQDFEHGMGFTGSPVTWIGLQRLQPTYISPRFEQLKGELQAMRRPILWNYFAQIFLWRLLAPYAMWVPSRANRYRFRVRRRHAYRVRLLWRARPQGLGFLRQLRLRIRLRWWRLQMFKQRQWRRRHNRWQRTLWSSRVLGQTPYLPWDLLLRAKHFKRLTPHLLFGATHGQALASPLTGEMPVERLFTLMNFKARISPEFQIKLAVGLQQLLLAQLTVILFYWHWVVLIAHPISFHWIDGRRSKRRLRRVAL